MPRRLVDGDDSKQRDRGASRAGPRMGRAGPDDRVRSTGKWD